MHAYGRTLRQAGDLRLLALPVGGGRDRYCVADGLEPVATFPTLEQALAGFEALCEATEDAVRWRRLATAGATDLEADRRRRGCPRRRRAGTAAPSPACAQPHSTRCHQRRRSGHGSAGGAP